MILYSDVHALSCSHRINLCTIAQSWAEMNLVYSALSGEMVPYRAITGMHQKSRRGHLSFNIIVRLEVSELNYQDCSLGLLTKSATSATMRHILWLHLGYQPIDVHWLSDLASLAHVTLPEEPLCHTKREFLLCLHSASTFAPQYPS
jgi:hypothetical protein